MTCNSGFNISTNIAPQNPQSPQSPQSCNYAIMLDINHQYCNMNCKYCGCRDNQTGANLYDYFKKDWTRLKNTINETNKKRGLVGLVGLQEPTKYYFEIWGGEPLYNFKALDETVKWLRDNYHDCVISLTTNGLLLASDFYCDWIIKNINSFQLSHDNLGQVQFRNVDPFVKGYDNIKALAQMGKLNVINSNVSEYQPSLYKAIGFWDGIFADWGVAVRTKLNHPCDTDNPKGFVFKSPEAIKQYFTEFEKLYREMKESSNAYLPYRDYLINEVQYFKTPNRTSACGDYQRLKHNVKNSHTNKTLDWTFTITTTGEYAECDLAKEVENPGSPLPDYCKGCRYEKHALCKSCGMLKAPSECLWQKARMELFEKLAKEEGFEWH